MHRRNNASIADEGERLDESTERHGSLGRCVMDCLTPFRDVISRVVAKLVETGPTYGGNSHTWWWRLMIDILP